MSIVDICMFSEQTEGTESFVSVWLKKPGDSVKQDEPIVEISTDKVSLEIPAPVSGFLKEILKPENEPVLPGEILGRIDSTRTAAISNPSAEHPSSSPQPSTVQDVTEEGLSPAVRKLLKENNLDPSQIKGSGRGGRLTHEDVLDFLSKRQPQTATVGSRMVPHTPMRRSIASHMLRSVQSAPHVTAVFEADFSRVLAHRTHQGSGDDRPSITAYLICAAVTALKQVPQVNSRWHDEGLEVFEDFNIGIGTAVEGGGLIVPVIHRAQNMSLSDVASRLRDLTRKARSGTLRTEDVQGGTFTISNHGVSGSILAAPIILANGQAAILGAGKLQQRPVVITGESGSHRIEPRPMMYITLTVDHRVLDAQQTNAFLASFVAALENWR